MPLALGWHWILSVEVSNDGFWPKIKFFDLKMEGVLRLSDMTQIILVFWFDFLHPSQQIFSHFGTSLPGLNLY